MFGFRIFCTDYVVTKWQGMEISNAAKIHFCSFSGLHAV